MASSMGIKPLTFHFLFVCSLVCSCAFAQSDRPGTLWGELESRPDSGGSGDSIRSSNAGVREARRPAGTEQRQFRPASSTSQPKRIPSVDGNGSTAEANDEQWWEKEADPNADYARPNQRQATDGRGDLIRSSQIVAIVGNEPILAGDLLGRINEALQPYMDQVPEEELEVKRWELIEQLLPSAIESKMVYLDFVRKMEPEQIAGLRASIYSQFDEKQLPELVQKAGVRNVTELEAKMRAVGASMEKTRRLFFEQVAAREVIRRGGEVEKEISPAELLEYYREHLDAYKIQAEAKWEQLTVSVSPYATDEERQQARFRLGKMGNAVLGGTPFSTVAKRDSQGPTAYQGGAHDWTVKGSLVSEPLDRKIFSLPIARLSDIIEDETGFHIIRVTERKEAGYVPFAEAQAGIRESILNEARDAKIKVYLADLKNRTYVWNYFGSKTAELDKKQGRF